MSEFVPVSLCSWLHKFCYWQSQMCKMKATEEGGLEMISSNRYTHCIHTCTQHTKTQKAHRPIHEICVGVCSGKNKHPVSKDT